MTEGNFEGFDASVDTTQLRELLAECIACNFRASTLSSRDLSGLTLISVDFSEADVRGAKFDGAILCWYDFQGSLRVMMCDQMQRARVTGTSFADIQVCDNPMARLACSPVDADTLRPYTSSTLSGAMLR